MKVMKFGGTSVQDASAIRQVEKILKQQSDEVLVVVSALSGITNMLVNLISNLEQKSYKEADGLIVEIRNRHLQLAENLGVNASCHGFIRKETSFLKKIVDSVDILGEITPKTNDLILATGEILSSFIIYKYFHSSGFLIYYKDPREIMKTLSINGETEVDWVLSSTEVNKLCRNRFRKNQFILTGGFVGSDAKGKTTTLGRGGSDYSAAVFASILHADRLEIWTDVDGILTTDPQLIPAANIVHEVTYDEASELAYFGAKVLHPKTIFPAVEQNIPVYVMNTFNPGTSGTRIVSKLSTRNRIKAIAFRKGITVINIVSNRMLGAYGFVSKVFEVFNQYKTPIDLISTSEVSISVTIDNIFNLDQILEHLNKIATTAVFSDKVIISAIGEGIRDDSGIAARFFEVLKEIKIFLVTMGASEINLSIVIDENDLEKTVSKLHYEFFEKSIN